MTAIENYFKNWSKRHIYLFHQFYFLDSFYPDLLVLTSQTKLKEIFELPTKYNHTKCINLTQTYTLTHMHVHTHSWFKLGFFWIFIHCFFYFPQCFQPTLANHCHFRHCVYSIYYIMKTLSIAEVTKIPKGLFCLKFTQ